MDNRKYQQPTTVKGSVSLDPTDILLKTPYSFTLNINPRRLKGIYGIDYNTYKPVLYKLFKHAGIEWRGTLEYNRFGRLHYHGWLVFDNHLSIAVFYESLKSIEDYNYKFDTVKILEDWKTYVFKNVKHMEQLAKYYQVPYILGETHMAPVFKTVEQKDREQILKTQKNARQLYNNVGSLELDPEFE